MVSALSDLITRCLAASGMSQAELARASGGLLSETQISQWVTESRPMLEFPLPATMDALGKGLGVDVDVVIFACAETIGMNIRREKLDEHSAMYLATLKDIPKNEVPRVNRMLRAYLRGN
jgi:transcriptional regulator with XRE-family HTH domain